jgi:L-aminopeptidase/D-esterase-like protein
MIDPMVQLVGDCEAAAIKAGVLEAHDSKSRLALRTKLLASFTSTSNELREQMLFSRVPMTDHRS